MPQRRGVTHKSYKEWRVCDSCKGEFQASRTALNICLDCRREHYRKLKVQRGGME